MDRKSSDDFSKKLKISISLCDSHFRQEALFGAGVKQPAKNEKWLEEDIHTAKHIYFSGNWVKMYQTTYNTRFSIFGTRLKCYRRPEKEWHHVWKEYDLNNHEMIEATARKGYDV